MIKSEAIKMMKGGYFVIHAMFVEGEEITMNEAGDVIDKNGLVLIDFWRYRTKAFWEIGWELFKSKNTVSKLEI